MVKDLLNSKQMKGDRSPRIELCCGVRKNRQESQTDAGQRFTRAIVVGVSNDILTDSINYLLHVISFFVLPYVCRLYCISLVTIQCLRCQQTAEETTKETASQAAQESKEEGQTTTFKDEEVERPQAKTSEEGHERREEDGAKGSQTSQESGAKSCESYIKISQGRDEEDNQTQVALLNSQSNDILTMWLSFHANMFQQIFLGCLIFFFIILTTLQLAHFY